MTRRFNSVKLHWIELEAWTTTVALFTVDDSELTTLTTRCRFQEATLESSLDVDHSLNNVMVPDKHEKLFHYLGELVPVDTSCPFHLHWWWSRSPEFRSQNFSGKYLFEIRKFFPPNLNLSEWESLVAFQLLIGDSTADANSKYFP